MMSGGICGLENYGKKIQKGKKNSNKLGRFFFYLVFCNCMTRAQVLMMSMGHVRAGQEWGSARSKVSSQAEHITPAYKLTLA